MEEWVIIGDDWMDIVSLKISLIIKEVGKVF